MIDTYTAFIRNVRRADEAIRIARQTRPAFDRFLQVNRNNKAWVGGFRGEKMM